MCLRTCPHIFIVDDDRSVLDLLVLVLAEAGYRVSPYSRGEQAVAAARAARPDMVLTDLRMPMMDGVALIERLRADHGPDLPIVLMTSMREIDAMVGHLQLAGRIHKPFHLEDLLAQVQRVLATISACP
jgi:DNA-binding response OmpR family regulator